MKDPLHAFLLMLYHIISILKEHGGCPLPVVQYFEVNTSGSRSVACPSPFFFLHWTKHEGHTYNLVRATGP